MIDSLLKHVDRALALTPWQAFDFTPDTYGLLTLHRPSNVDDRQTLSNLIDALRAVAEQTPILFPVHPRTRSRIAEWNLAIPSTWRLVEPLPYLTFLGLMAKAKFVLTDSGGIQEETTALNVPCLTLRWNTERPVTVTQGTNKLVGTDAQKINENLEAILRGEWKTGQQPPLWDGHASRRIVEIVDQWLKKRT
jgi:UDP-N-acetylglucosamine 2-epimerase (non-hydrolysing)